MCIFWHNYGKWQDETVLNCQGTQKRVCSSCGEIDVRATEYHHEYSPWEIVSKTPMIYKVQSSMHGYTVYERRYNLIQNERVCKKCGDTDRYEEEMTISEKTNGSSDW